MYRLYCIQCIDCIVYMSRHVGYSDHISVVRSMWPMSLRSVGVMELGSRLYPGTTVKTTSPLLFRIVLRALLCVIPTIDLPLT